MVFKGTTGAYILGDLGTASRDEGIFVGESLLQQGKLSPTKIPSSRLAAYGEDGERINVFVFSTPN